MQNREKDNSCLRNVLKVSAIAAADLAIGLAPIPQQSLRDLGVDPDTAISIGREIYINANLIGWGAAAAIHTYRTLSKPISESEPYIEIPNILIEALMLFGIYKLFK